TCAIGGDYSVTEVIVVLVVENYLRKHWHPQNLDGTAARGATRDCGRALRRGGRAPARPNARGGECGNLQLLGSGNVGDTGGGNRSGRRRRNLRGRVWLGHASFGVSLRQREWNRADSEKQKQVKRASDKMCFDGGVNLLFHRVVLVRILIFPVAKLYFWSGKPFLVRDAKKCQYFFLNDIKMRSSGVRLATGPVRPAGGCVAYVWEIRSRHGCLYRIGRWRGITKPLTDEVRR